jgi:hypothetical protein
MPAGRPSIGDLSKWISTDKRLAPANRPGPVRGITTVIVEDCRPVRTGIPPCQLGRKRKVASGSAEELSAAGSIPKADGFGRNAGHSRSLFDAPDGRESRPRGFGRLTSRPSGPGSSVRRCQRQLPTAIGWKDGHGVVWAVLRGHTCTG